MIVEWSSQAQQDRREAFRYYFIEVGSLQTAERTDSLFDTRVALLASHPKAGRPGRVRGTRELVIRDTPYLAAYRIEDSTVLILRLIHHAQRWPRRL